MRPKTNEGLWRGFTSAPVLLYLLVLVALAVFLVRPCSAQARGTYGKHCNGVLTHVGQPRIGTNREFQTWLTSGWFATPAGFFLGARLPVPQRLPWGCWVYIRPLAYVQGMTDGGGSWIFWWKIPRDARLIGLEVHEQFAFFNWVTQTEWFTSNAGWFRVGV